LQFFGCTWDGDISYEKAEETLLQCVLQFPDKEIEWTQKQQLKSQIRPIMQSPWSPKFSRFWIMLWVTLVVLFVTAVIFIPTRGKFVAESIEWIKIEGSSIAITIGACFGIIVGIFLIFHRLFMAIVLRLIGIVFVIYSFFVSSETVIHQLYGALYLLGGFVIIGIGCVVDSYQHTPFDSASWFKKEKK
jgi:hypothetical protein